MTLPRRAALAGLALAPWALRAQPADWPQRPIKIIVPAPPGGGYDRTARPLAQELAAQLKQPVVVENRASAGNIVGAQAGARAPADGYTLTMTGMVNTIAQTLYDNVGFDIVGDFAHIAQLGDGAQWLVVRAELGVKTLDELLRLARKEKLDYASSGPGSTGHLLMELLQRATGVQLVHVPYKGGGPALQDVLAGVVPITVVPPAAVLTHVRAGKLRVLAVSGAQRSPELPEAPTFAELGHPQLTVSSWIGLSAPKGTPAAIVARVAAATQAALKAPAVARQLETEGLQIKYAGPEDYSRLVRADTERWGALIKALQLKAQ